MADDHLTPDEAAAVADRLISLVETAFATTTPTDPAPATPPTPTTATKPNPPALNLGNLANILTPAPTPKPRVEMPTEPDLPTGILPPPLETWITTTATLANVPPGMIMFPFLAATGGVIGNRVALQLHPGWSEYPTLWVALVALTGTRKTPAIAAARRPFDILHDELHANWAAAESGTSAAPLITPHATWYRLQHTLESTRGLILYRDELVGLLRAIDGRRGEDRQRYLSLWSHDPIHQTDRPTIHHPVVAIIGGIQPLLLTRLRNHQPDGLLERFLPILAGGPATPWSTDLPVAAPPIEPVLAILRTLHQLPETVTTLSSHAEDLWRHWHDAQLQLTHPSPLIVGGFYRKYHTQAARLALILHTLWHPHMPGQPLDRATIDRAIALMEYLRIHLHRTIVFLNERHPVRSPAELLATRIRETLASHYPNWIGHNQLAIQLGRPAGVILNTAVQQLETLGHLESRVIKQQGRGRPVQQHRHVNLRDNSR